MIKNISVLMICVLFQQTVYAQWPASVTMIKTKANDSVTVTGDLASGKLINDLSWASTSTNACFVATQNSKYRGNHVFFATTIPPHSIMNISVTPTDETADLSIYAYMSVTDEHYMVPDLPSCITCEADYKWDGVWKGKVQTSERKVEFNNPTNGPFNILIGVSGPKEATKGSFQVKVRLRS